MAGIKVNFSDETLRAAISIVVQYRPKWSKPRPEHFVSDVFYLYLSESGKLYCRENFRGWKRNRPWLRLCGFMLRYRTRRNNTSDRSLYFIDFAKLPGLAARVKVLIPHIKPERRLYG